MGENFLLQLQSIVLLLIFVFIVNQWFQKVLRIKGKEPPQPSGALPVIGHLHLLRCGKPLYQVLGDMADEHGPAFILRLGSRRTLIISGWELAKECFTINDKALAARPTNAASKHMGYVTDSDGIQASIDEETDSTRLWRVNQTNEAARASNGQSRATNEPRDILKDTCRRGNRPRVPNQRLTDFWVDVQR